MVVVLLGLAPDLDLDQVLGVVVFTIFVALWRQQQHRRRGPVRLERPEPCPQPLDRRSLTEVGRRGPDRLMRMAATIATTTTMMSPNPL